MLLDAFEAFEWAYMVLCSCDPLVWERELFCECDCVSFGDRVYGGGGGVLALIAPVLLLKAGDGCWSEVKDGAKEELVDGAGDGRLESIVVDGDLRSVCRVPLELKERHGDAGAVLPGFGLSAPFFGFGELGKPTIVVADLPDNGPFPTVLALLLAERTETFDGDGRGCPILGLGTPPLMFGM